jgi:hypothetical protein
VPIVVFIADPVAGEPSVSPTTAQALGDLGVTRIALLTDPCATAVVLDGWALDAAHTQDMARVLFPGDSLSVRTFHELGHVGVAKPDRTRRF